MSGPTRGEVAEIRVYTRLRDALPPEYHVFHKVRWVGRTRPFGPSRDGEADIVVVHPDGGLLVIEVKDGRPSRDHLGRWYLGDLPLDESPFEQAEGSERALRLALSDLPGWPAGAGPRTGHAVAFPEVDLASLPPGHVLLGPDAPRPIVLDAGALDSPSATHRWVERAYAFWVGDGTRGQPMDETAVNLVDEFLSPTVRLRPLVRRGLDDAAGQLLFATRAQRMVLDGIRDIRRAAIVGPAGSGKSILAAERARRLARDGFRTLVVCFNQPLAVELAEALADAPAPGGLEVHTFHGLCETLAGRAGVLPAARAERGQDWFDRVLPGALDAAIAARPEDRFHAVIVDEGQDFARPWLESLDLLLDRPGEDVLWAFHDPGQALHRADALADPDVRRELGLEEVALPDNYRNPGPVNDLAARFYRGPESVEALRDDGEPPWIREAEPGEATNRELHRVLADLERDGVGPHRIAVLTGCSLAASDAWRAKKRISPLLWNGSYDDDGRSLGLPAGRAPREPGDVIRFDSIRRFKGLEREVVVLVELPEDGPRLDELLYVGLTRPTALLVVIAPPGLAGRLR
ncbi:MAG: NERD domain-containing protein [Chloroflexi bacterium]|nr:NERD domain-containing protein [Chloroflexota bacterium]